MERDGGGSNVVPVVAARPVIYREKFQSAAWNLPAVPSRRIPITGREEVSRSAETDQRLQRATTGSLYSSAYSAKTA